MSRFIYHVTSAARTVLQQSDFTYLGSFKPPQTVSGVNTDFGPGLTHRYVSGALRFFSTIAPFGNTVYEFNYPGESVGSPPTATAITDWGDIYDGKKFASTSPPGTVVTCGLKWDDTDQRLYAGFGDAYSAQGPTAEPCLMYATLGTPPASTGFGPWKISAGWKRAKSGLLDIPSIYQSSFGGRRFGIGFGGYESLVINGGTSMGPALAVMNPITNESANSIITTPIVCGYPYTLAYSQDRCHHDWAHNSPYEYDDAWEHQGSTYYWSWADQGMGACWIHGANKTGVFYASAIGTNRVYYETSTVKSTNYVHGFFVYDPADLIRVYNGTVSEWQIQPASSWSNEFTSTEIGSYPLGPWQDFPPYSIEGCTYDSVSGKLFIKVQFDNVHVYSVAT